MRLIATHVQRPAGVFSTRDAHILPEKISGIEKGTSWLLRRIEYIGPYAAQWAQSMLQNRGIEGVLMGLLSLTNKSPRHSVDEACRIAQSHGAYHLRSVRQLIDPQSSIPPAPQQVNHQQYATRQQARQSIFQYIEGILQSQTASQLARIPEPRSVRV